MRDGPVRRAVKLAARALFFAELSVRRFFARRRGHRFFVLTGSCQGCGSCCEEPGIQVDVWTWHLRSLRRLFLWWQHTVNGFDFVRVEKPRMFVFKCTHFDPKTRRCDSYESRPGICRDYPRAQEYQAAPDFFDRCGFRAAPKNGDKLRAAIDATALSPEKKEQLKRNLGLD